MKKTNLLFTLALATIMASCAGTKEETSWPEVKTEHKPFTRWWWMGSAVDKANLTYNLEEFAKVGIGGVEITPIYGVMNNEANDIEYLSPKWMEMYKFTVDEAKRLGMEVDLNNGTGWPFGGPNVSVEDAATRIVVEKFPLAGGKKLDKKIVVSDPKQAEVATMSMVMAYSDKGEKINVTELLTPDKTLNWTAPEGNWTVYAVFNGKTLQEVKRAAPGGEGLVMNHLSKTAFDNYEKRFDEAFTKDMPAPRHFFNDSYEVYGADWTPAMFTEFENRRGYKLEEYLPEFLANDSTEMSRRVVTDYRQTMHDVLMDDFVTPWKEWAHKKGSLVRNQSHGSPANIIDVYAAVDIPECEIFGRTIFDIPNLRQDSLIKFNDSNPMVLKFASSAAHITGKTLVSCETFTWLTDHFRTSLSQCKPELDQILTSGVNHVFFHGSTYSPKDAEWPGWLFYASINMSHTNPQWRDASELFTYITRCQSFLQMGQADNEILLYFPIYDNWNKPEVQQLLQFSIHGLEKRVEAFNSSVTRIMENGYDPDYISDAFIATLKFENGYFVTSGGVKYKTLIVPNADVMPVETLEKIISLAEQGGSVIFDGGYPQHVPGLKDYKDREIKLKELVAKLPQSSFTGSAVSNFGKGKLITGSDYKEMISSTGVASESFTKDFGGQFIRRQFDGGKIYFLTMLKNNPIDGWVTLGKEAKSVMIFDPMTGRKGVAKSKIEDGKTKVYLQLGAGESVILKTFDNKSVNDLPWVYQSKTADVLNLKNGWSLSFVESEPAITETYPIDTLCSWTTIDNPAAKVNTGNASYKSKFTINNTKGSEFVLDLNRVCESARVKINGKDVATLWAVPYSTNIGQYLNEGENSIEVEVINLPANRIVDYTRRGVEWRKFKNANIARLGVQGKPIPFEEWSITDSGLIGPVTITRLENTEVK